MKAQIKATLETTGSGAIVNTSSVGSLKGNPGLEAYGASKRGVNSLTQTAAIEYGPEGLRGLTITKRDLHAHTRIRTRERASGSLWAPGGNVTNAFQSLDKAAFMHSARRLRAE
ncbi:MULTISPECIES: SDR family NAD(P)-dependent oxidoreductase [unclassified Paenibacillus]|uniref:SDR family NAD(P)-dependent oxidoreductase n=1 Tax=unclassified Paenibacillus TaxID=185978 RepID=UPI00362A43AF